jgi:hypothetical protein
MRLSDGPTLHQTSFRGECWVEVCFRRYPRLAYEWNWKNGMPRQLLDKFRLALGAKYRPIWVDFFSRAGCIIAVKWAFPLRQDVGTQSRVDARHLALAPNDKLGKWSCGERNAVLLGLLLTSWSTLKGLRERHLGAIHLCRSLAYQFQDQTLFPPSPF